MLIAQFIHTSQMPSSRSHDKRVLQDLPKVLAISGQAKINASHRAQSLNALLIAQNHSSFTFRHRHFLPAEASAPQAPHFFASMPSGGVVSTFALPTSSQFVLSAVPLLSV